ncbi:hypothetical protein H0H81_006811 [Sphagnurus paluster]|uniref:Cytochrome P450 n=1 Tax=Sphagnurus paluster TaxID=117069 RepID=A0A9P7K146_9AGAR|nr:hypothetical protein H0H81_006811 [Sphagnurus paluster]
MALLGPLQELYATSFFSLNLRFFGYNIPALPTFFAIFVTSRVIKLLNGIRSPHPSQSVNYLPGYRVPLQPYTFPSGLFASSWWNVGVDKFWLARTTLLFFNLEYQEFGTETISAVPFIYGVPTLFTSNLDVAKQVLSGQTQPGQLKARHFDKSESANRVLIKWGMNLVAALNGDTWRKHRRIVGPAFNNKLYERVWAETINLYRQIEAGEGWVTKDTIEIPVVQKITTKMALLVIARCGFGLSFDWSAPPISPDGTTSVQESLRILTDSYIVSLIAPDWVRYLPLPGCI